MPDDGGGIFDAALRYVVTSGFSVLPIVHGSKAPAVKWLAFMEHAPTDAELEEWFATGSNGVGIVTGAVSGIVVLDFDGEAGEEAFFKLHLQTPSVKTPHGYHAYFSHPGGRVRNAVKLREGIDVRADGGYVVCPPTEDYSWMPSLALGDVPLLPAPKWAVRREDGPPDVVPLHVVPPHSVKQGGRNDALAKLGGYMRRKDASEAVIAAALLAENSTYDPPLSEAEVRKVAHSVAQYAPAPVVGPSVMDAPTVVPFEVLTVKALYATPDPPASAELLGSLVVRGARTLIGAHTGHGKTTFELQAAKAVVTGKDFLGFPGDGGGRVLFVDAEQGLRTIKRRLVEAGLEDNTAIDYLRVPDGLALDTDTEERERLEKVLEAEYAAVFVDPLYKLHRGDSNDERAAVDLMRHFDAWREELGFALVMATHCRKPSDKDPKFTMHDLFGSSAYTRGAEVVLGLQFVGPGYSRLHFFKDRDGDLPIGTSWGLLFDRATGFVHDPNDGQAKATVKDKVRVALENTANLTVAELVKATGNAERSVKTALTALEANAVVGPSGVKSWSLSAADSVLDDLLKETES